MSTRRERLAWESIALGWLAALAVGAVASLLLWTLYDALVGAPPARGGITASLVAVSLLAGFLAYLAGGYIAGRGARGAGGLYGIMTAFMGLLIGLVLTLVLASSGLIFAWAVAVPPASFGLHRGILPGGAALFVANVFGGYVGGKLGEPPDAGVRRPEA